MEPKLEESQIGEKSVFLRYFYCTYLLFKYAKGCPFAFLFYRTENLHEKYRKKLVI